MAANIFERHDDDLNEWLTRKLDHSEQLNILSAATNCIMLYDTTDCLHDMRLCYFPAVSPAPEHAPAA